MPVTWGLLRPRVLLPACATQWSEERKRLVLAHELAHVHRADWFVHLAAKLACAVYWFNPLFWMAYNRLCRESEQACDDAVLKLGVDRRDYATHLLEIARALSVDRGLGTALAMARPSNIERRFRALLDARLEPPSADTPSRVHGRLAWCCWRCCRSPPSTFRPRMPRSIFGPPVSLRCRSQSARLSGAAMVTAIRDVRTGGPLAIGGDRCDAAVPSSSIRRLRCTATKRAAAESKASSRSRCRSTPADMPTSCRSLKGLGFGLDENARLAVRTWVFVPARRQGRSDRFHHGRSTFPSVWRTKRSTS